VLTERVSKFVSPDACICLETIMGWTCTKTPSQPYNH